MAKNRFRFLFKGDEENTLAVFRESQTVAARAGCKAGAGARL
jgi:hypothetical protein